MAWAAQEFQKNVLSLVIIRGWSRGVRRSLPIGNLMGRTVQG